MTNKYYESFGFEVEEYFNLWLEFVTSFRSSTEISKYLKDCIIYYESLFVNEPSNDCIAKVIFDKKEEIRLDLEQEYITQLEHDRYISKLDGNMDKAMDFIKKNYGEMIVFNYFFTCETLLLNADNSSALFLSLLDNSGIKKRNIFKKRVSQNIAVIVEPDMKLFLINQEMLSVKGLEFLGWFDSEVQDSFKKYLMEINNKLFESSLVKEKLN